MTTVFQLLSTAAVGSLLTLLGTSIQKRRELRASEYGKYFDTLRDAYGPLRKVIGRMMRASDSAAYHQLEKSAGGVGSPKVTLGGGPTSDEFRAALDKMREAEREFEEADATVALLGSPSKLRSAITEFHEDFGLHHIDGLFLTANSSLNERFTEGHRRLRSDLAKPDRAWEELTAEYFSRRIGEKRDRIGTWDRLVRFSGRNL